MPVRDVAAKVPTSGPPQPFDDDSSDDEPYVKLDTCFRYDVDQAEQAPPTAARCPFVAEDPKDYGETTGRASRLPYPHVIVRPREAYQPGGKACVEGLAWSRDA